MAKKHIVTQAFSAPRKDGVMIPFAPGREYDVPAEILKGREHLFYEVDWPEIDKGPVEVTAATPGKKRTTAKKKTTSGG